MNKEDKKLFNLLETSRTYEEMFQNIGNINSSIYLCHFIKMQKY